MAGPLQPIRRHPIFARVYARISPAMDAQGAAEHRRTLLADLAGRVLEVAPGNGLTFAHLRRQDRRGWPQHGGHRQALPSSSVSRNLR
jgi:hypothetical protein